MSSQVPVVGVLTVIPQELRMMRHALRMGNVVAEKSKTGTIYYVKELPARRRRPALRLVLTCIGEAGNYDASAATTELIERFGAGFLVLSGIAAGMRDRVKIGDAVLSQRVVGYESAAIEAGGRSIPRPQGGPLEHSTSQDLASYLAGEPTRTAATIFDRIHGERPKPTRGKSVDFRKHVASALSIREGVVASGEKLLRDPTKLTTMRETQHGKIEAGEMEAIGFWTACTRQGVRWLVVRGISDFGDELKDDRFHVLASAAAAAVTADFIERGLQFPAMRPLPVPEVAGGRSGGIGTIAPVPPVPGTLRPGRFATSSRLDGAVNELVHALDAGERLVALYGRPGDGKTQVAQRLAGLRAVDIYYALPRFDGHNAVWHDGLRHLASELLGRPPRASDPEALAAVIRSALARRGDVRLILDNVDAPSPIDLNMLLSHDTRAACILVGACDPGVARTVRLPPPNAAEFRDIFLANRGAAAAPSDEQARLLDQIGAGVSNSAIVALCVAQGCSAARLTEDLTLYGQLLPGQAYEAQVERVIGRSWAALGREEQQRVAFVAALGEADVPLSWLPARLAAGSPRTWRLLEFSGVLARTSDDRVRIHRLVAHHADVQRDVDVAEDLMDTLVTWADDLALFDELKLDGRRTHAFLHAVRYLKRHSHLRDSAGTREAMIEKTYVDLTPFRGAIPMIEAHLRVVLPEGRALSTMHTAVLGQLVDTLSDGAARSDALRGLRAEVVAELRRRMDGLSLPPRIEDDHDWLDASAMHHLGKYLAKHGASGEERRRGVEMLKGVDRYAATVSERSPHRARWRVRAASARYQLASGDLIPTEEAARLLLDTINEPDFTRPNYLRLKIVERLLRLKSVPTSILSDAQRVELFADGLARCELDTNPETQAEFLLFAGTEIARTRDLERYTPLLHTAAAVLARLDRGAAGFGRTAKSIAHPFHKASELREDEAGFTGLHSALLLYAEAEVGPYVATRAAAVLRDLGLPLEALSVIDTAVVGPPPAVQDYWIAFERAKALRWAGRLEEAVQAAHGLLSEHPGHERSVTDEIAKLACCRGRQDEAAPLLEANIARYEAAGERALAQQCRSWLANLLGEQRVQGGLLEDEWRGQRRRSAVGAERLGVTDASARAAASSIVQALKQARVPRAMAQGSGATAWGAASPQGSS